ncbi:MAG: hypothetical protein DI537_10290 [Stutzerimonas stutzeri]|nr:MAG: hypothetical protein DI537_10290 [Stutzerimonas stutzeri]
MSRSKRDQRGKRTNGEIMGRNTTRVVDGRLVYEVGGEDVGSPARKADAKQRVSRQRRLDDKRILRGASQEQC